MKMTFNPVGSGRNTRFLRHLACLCLLLCSSRASATSYIVQNSVLKVSLESSTGEIQVTELDTIPNPVWTQDITPTGFHTVNPTSASGLEINATIKRLLDVYTIDLVLDASAKKFTLTVYPPNTNSNPNYPYATLPAYPFVYAGTGGSDPWYYVQNNGGEGTMWSLTTEKTLIRGYGGWTGGQPWWGVTDLNQAMMARLVSFAQLENPSGPGDSSAYKVPLQIEYSFYHTGGYVGLAKAYRASQNTGLTKLAGRADVSQDGNPDLLFLKDGTYAYFWDDDLDATGVSLIEDMTAAGLNRVIAMFSLGDDPLRIDEYVYNKIATYGWLGGLYQTPTPNLSTICPDINDWVNKLLLGTNGANEAGILAANANHVPPVYKWEELDTAKWAEPQWNGNCPAGTYPYCDASKGLPLLSSMFKNNLRVVYHDTLPQQLGPSIYSATDHGGPYIQDIEANRTGRQQILDDTRTYTDTNHPNHFIAGSGEGTSAWWTVPHLDYWEGGMEESTYGDIMRHPIMDHGEDFADDCHPLSSPCTPGDPGSWSTQEWECLDETHRVPLLALQWHDYVAETWNWRNSTFVVSSLSWKKDLFNILYCGMPMWHVTSALWSAHSTDYINSYWKLLPVRRANGFAEMTNHGWVDVNPGDRAIQYTWWDNNNHVIVNFSGSDQTYTDPTYGTVTVPAHGYAMLPDPVSQDCENTGSTTPDGWTDSGAAPIWNYSANPLDGGQSLYLPTTGTVGSLTWVDFANQAEVWVSFKIKLTTTSQGTKTIGGLATNGGTITQLFQVSTVGLKPGFGGVQTGTGFTAGLVYNVWLHYRKGAGSNGIIDIAFSDGGTKPSDPDHFAQSTVYTGTNEAGRLFLGTSAHTAFDIVYDNIRVDNSEIGDVP